MNTILRLLGAIEALLFIGYVGLASYSGGIGNFMTLAWFDLLAGAWFLLCIAHGLLLLSGKALMRSALTVAILAIAALIAILFAVVLSAGDAPPLEASAWTFWTYYSLALIVLPAIIQFLGISHYGLYGDWDSWD